MLDLVQSSGILAAQQWRQLAKRWQSRRPIVHHALPFHQPINPTTQAMHGLKHAVGSSLREVPPSHSQTQTRLRFIKRPQRGFITNPSVPAENPLRLCHIERDTTDGPPNLRCKVMVTALNCRNQRPRKFSDSNCMFKNRRALWMTSRNGRRTIVHAPKGAGLRDNV